MVPRVVAVFASLAALASCVDTDWEVVCFQVSDPAVSARAIATVRPLLSRIEPVERRALHQRQLARGNVYVGDCAGAGSDGSLHVSFGGRGDLRESNDEPLLSVILDEATLAVLGTTSSPWASAWLPGLPGDPALAD